MITKTDAEEYFTIDRGVGNGYDVYYRRKNGCYHYIVTTTDSGCLMYSHTHRVPREIFNSLKEKHDERH